MFYLAPIFEIIMHTLYESSFLNKSLSQRDINLLCIPLRNLVISSTPLSNNSEKSLEEMYPRSPQHFPCTFCRRDGIGFLSSTFPAVKLKAKISPRWLMTRWSLSPKNQPVEVLPRFAIGRNTLWDDALRMWQTVKMVESTKEMPEHWPKRPCRKTNKWNRDLFIRLTNRLYDGNFLK